MKIYIIVFILFFNNAISQTKKSDCFSLNPFVDVFIENLINKEVNLDKNYLTLMSLRDKDGNYNIDLELTSGDINTFKIVSPKEIKKEYGNITILLVGKTDEDLKFLKKSIGKSKKVFLNRDKSKNNMSFYDEDYVWSTFFDKKKELINFYIPEEKESADKIFNEIKNDIHISPNFKNIDCNCF
ncbi:hypothetical protein EG349_08555 [Chryseobacterium shandongense]|uniref:Uncharacterized protein n=1 Tax=Chryseobacterium shandongense TaxID=1493872 RepID=A0AAD0YDQ1_9FLAO|nr:hypothetical protein [Chryseobacterium shandongense]AZA86834.1 hypothetical protein EG349_08555 [Chryseobacterium shandongense]AZA95250.1 hypothetical protein EG353_06605 [Chryseobacterium shandongense]